MQVPAECANRWLEMMSGDGGFTMDAMVELLEDLWFNYGARRLLFECSPQCEGER
jgi:hypothetical protein